MTTTTTTAEMRHIASNPDASDLDDLAALAEFVGLGCRPAPQAAQLWPDMPGNERVKAAVNLADYCRTSIRARERRLRGEIELAREEERRLEWLYQALPAWAQW